jgi:hypothetical protein
VLLLTILGGFSIERREQVGDARIRCARRRRFLFFEERGGMRSGIHLLQRAQRDVRVNLCGLDVLMAEDHLDMADVGSVLVHVRRHGVAQQVARAEFAELRGLDVLPHHAGQMIAAEGFAFGGQKHCEVVRFECELRAHFRDVLLQPCRRPLADGHVAVFLALALAYQHQAPVQRKVHQFQIDDLPATQSRGIDHFEDDAITQAQRIDDVRLHHHLLDLGHRKDVLGQHPAHARQVDLRRRIVQDVVLPRHPAKPHAQRHQARVLAAEGQRLAVLFAIEEQVALIAFEHGARDLDRFPQAVIVGPLEKEAEIGLTALDGVLGVAAHAQRAQMLVHEGFERRLRRGLGLAFPADAGHHFTAARCVSPWPFGFSAPFGLGTTTTGRCGLP